jgi:hypothetical protein
MTAIDPRMFADMREAIRLTCEGHPKAAALMQRLFQGKRHSGSRPDAWAGSAATGTSPPSARHASRVFDVDHTTGAVTNADDAIYRGVASGTRAAPSIPRTSEKIRGFLDQINLPGTTGKPFEPTGPTGAPVPGGARFRGGHS